MRIGIMIRMMSRKLTNTMKKLAIRSTMSMMERMKVTRKLKKLTIK